MKFKINYIFDLSAIISGLILLSLAILTFCDVFGRRFLNSPVTGTIELVEFGMALVAFLAMPRAFFLNANVSADFIKNVSNNTFQIFMNIFRFILMIVIMSMMAYATTKEAMAFFKNERVTIDLEIYFFPFYYAASVGMWLSVVAIVFWLISALRSENS